MAGCSGVRQEADVSPAKAADRWPTPQEGQREVMLLGTSHLAQTPDRTSNTYALDAGDILGQQRQHELETITDRLAVWDPDRIAIEYPATEQQIADRAFTAYRDDAADRTTVDGWDVERSSEIVQLGFRLAETLGHETIGAVDHNQPLTALLTDAEQQQLPTSPLADPDAVEYPLPDFARLLEEEQRRLDSGSLVEHYRRMNTLDPGSFSRMQDEHLYATGFEESEPGEHTALDLMTSWFQRNLRIAANLWTVPDAGAERVLVVYGASHIPALLHILTGTPMMAPVTPLPYLTD